MQTISDLTTDELYDIIERTVEKKIYEILNDDDNGSILKQSVKQRLQQQDLSVKQGNIGRKFEDVINELGIE